MNARFAPSGRLRGTLVPPPDKSISHRAALLGAMSAEPVRIANYLHAPDTTATLAAMRTLGALVHVTPAEVVVRGTGLREAIVPDHAIDVGNAGTLLRLLPGWLAAQDGRAYTLDGDARIRRRPVDRIAAPLRAMGARVEATDGRYPPFVVHGGRLGGIDHTLPVASAQVKSCVLLAGLGTAGVTTVREPAPSRDHTERMLAAAGVRIRREGDVVSVAGHDELALESVTVPGDPSSAAFAIAACILVPGSRLVVSGVSLNWTRTAFLRIAQRMGGIVVGDLEGPGAPVDAPEPVGELDVAAGSLVGTTVEADEVPLAIDELPLVALLGCFAEGETVVRGAPELRLGESDRIVAVVEGLRGLGGELEATADGFVVHGTGGLAGGTLAAHGQPGLAMLGAVAGLASRDGVDVVGVEAAAVGHPAFGEDLAALVHGGL